jgi:hypothetical protein
MRRAGRASAADGRGQIPGDRAAAGAGAVGRNRDRAARASILGAFTAGQGYCADADYSPRSWLINRTRITKGAAVAHIAWARRAAAHPEVAQALAKGYVVSESVARRICQWSDRLPEDCREAADRILIGAPRAGMDLRYLAELAGEIYQRSLPDNAAARTTCSRTGPCTWRPRSRAPGSCMAT